MNLKAVVKAIAFKLEKIQKTNKNMKFVFYYLHNELISIKYGSVEEERFLKQIYSVKMILKYKTDVSIYEEDIVLIEMDSIDELKEKCLEYVDLIQEDLNDHEFVELYEIVNWNLSSEKFDSSMNFKEVYSEFIDEDEIA